MWVIISMFYYIVAAEEAFLVVSNLVGPTQTVAITWGNHPCQIAELTPKIFLYLIPRLQNDFC